MSVYESKFKLSGLLSSSFNSTFNSVFGTVNKLGGKLKDLEKSKSNIDRFQKLRESSANTRKEYQQLKLKINRTNKELKNNHNPSQKAINDFNKMKDKSQRLEETCL